MGEFGERVCGGVRGGVAESRELACGKKGPRELGGRGSMMCERAQRRVLSLNIGGRQNLFGAPPNTLV